MRRLVWIVPLIWLLPAAPAFGQSVTGLDAAVDSIDGASCKVRLRVTTTSEFGNLNCGAGNACDAATSTITVTGQGAPYQLLSSTPNYSQMGASCPANPQAVGASTVTQIYLVPANTAINVTAQVSQRCNGVTQFYGNQAVTGEFTPLTLVDKDGDGYAMCGQATDCNDQDANINPGVDKDGDKSNSCDDCDDTNADKTPGMDRDGDQIDSCVDCNDYDANNTKSLDPDNPDHDHDGFNTCNDCRDDDPTIHPGANEVCNGKDDNCNGAVDENVATTKCRACGVLGADDPVNFVSGAMTTRPQRDFLLKGINGLDLDFYRIYSNQVRNEVPQAMKVPVSGLVNDPSIETVQVNGTPVTVNNGTWQTTLTLAPGPNTITVTAEVGGVPIEETATVTAMPTSRFSMGTGWTHTFNLYLQTKADGTIAIQDPNGLDESFRPDGAGGYLPNNGSQSTLASQPDGSFLWVKGDGEAYTFDSGGFLTAISDRFSNTITLTYQDGRVSTITDTLGRHITFSYNSSDNLDHVTGPSGVLAQYTYDGQGNLATATNSAGETTTYLYEDSNDPHNLTAIRNNAAQTILTVQYDAQDRTVAMAEAGGNHALAIAYTGVGQATVTNSKGEVTDYTRTDDPMTGMVSMTTTGVGCATCLSGSLVAQAFGPNNKLTQSTDRNGHITAYTYDTRGNVLTKTEAVGTLQERTTTYTYHPDFDLELSETVKSVLDPAQFRRVTFDYDNDGNSVPNEAPGLTVRRQIVEGLTRDAAGTLVPFQEITSYTYDSKGQVILVDGPRTDAADVTTTSYYPTVSGDPNSGLLQSMTRSTGGTPLTTTYADYDANGNPGRITDPNSQGVLYTYDGLNRVKTITQQADGSLTQYTYDANGNLSHVVLPNGNSLDYTYDPANRLTTISDGLGNSLHYGYDTEGNRISEERHDPSDVIKSFLAFQYDSLNRLQRVTNPDTSYTEYGYDPGGNRTSMKDPNGATTGYGYDALNRLTTTTQPGTIVTAFGYDSQDHLTSVTDPNTNVTTYEYDDAGRLLKTVSPDTGTTVYTYDDAGNLKTKRDANNILTGYQYDALNRLTLISFPNASQNIAYGYDSPTAGNGLGRLTSMTDPSGTTVYSYTAKGQLAQQITTLAGPVASFTTAYQYDLNGNLTGMTYPDGRQVTYGFDGADRMAEVTGAINGVTTTLAELSNYLPFGPAQTLAMANGLTTSTSYDPQYRFGGQSVTGPASTLLNHSYGYDFNGNILTISDALDPTHNKSYGYDPLNRLTSATGPWGTGGAQASLSYTYDGVGNRLTEGGDLGASTYSYSANRLTGTTGAKTLAFTYDSNGNTFTENSRTYTYDQNNRLIEAAENASTVGSYSYDGQGRRVTKTADGQTTAFLYDQQSRVIAEVDGTGQITTDYLWLPDRPLAKIDQLASQTPPAAPTGLTAVAGDREISLSWTANTEPDVIGYRVYYGTSPGSHPNMLDIGNVTTATITGLTNGVAEYMVVTAYNSIGESDESAEVSAIPNLNPAGQPGYTPGTDAGYFVWVGTTHLRWSGDGQAHTFTGTITTDGAFWAVQGVNLEPDDAFTVNGDTITFSGTVTSDDDGLDFRTTGTQVTFNIQQDGANHPETVTIGASGQHPSSIPFTLMVTGETNTPPTAPSENDPADGGEVASLTPDLSVNDAADPDGDPLTYTFELYADPGLTTLVASASDIPQTPSTTTWTVPVTLNDNTHYYWRARANDPYETGPWMTPASFFVNTVNDPPTAPTLSSPANGSQVMTLQPMLEVGNAVDPDDSSLTYTFEVYTDPGLTVLVASASNIAQGTGMTSWTVPTALTEDTTYYWRAQAVDPHGLAGPWMMPTPNPASFFVNVTNGPPTVPTIVSPADQSTVITFQPTLIAGNSTDPENDPLQYEFEVDTVSSFNGSNLLQSGPLPAGSGGQTSWLVPQPLTENTQYYWRVRANDGQAMSGWATASFFVNTVNDPPTAPTLANPPDGSQVATLTPTLTVNNATDPEGDAVTYRFELYADPFNLLLVAASPEITQGTGTTSWTVSPALQENHLYWWRVRATDSHGLPGPWMSQAVFQVSVQNDPPTAPIPLLPLDGDTLTTATPTLQWLDSLDPEGASLTYQVEVYSDKKLTTLAASVSGLPGTLLTTTWQVTPALLEKTTYYWRVRGSDGALSSAWSGTQSFKVGKLTTRGTPRYFAAKPGGLNGRRVATIGSLGGLTGGETEAIFFYQTDHLGTPLMMTDQVGQVVWEAEYLPFGEPVSINEDVDGDGVMVVNNLRFQGQYQDQETGMHYNLARDYRTFIGRYMTVDPILSPIVSPTKSISVYNLSNPTRTTFIVNGLIEIPNALHPYQYALNNPLANTDPLGLSTWTAPL
jgi:RHS repeat-associated protein